LCPLTVLVQHPSGDRDMRETLDGFQGGLQIEGRIVTNLHYADDIIMLATSETELQELVDRLDRVSLRLNTAYSSKSTRPK